MQDQSVSLPVDRSMHEKEMRKSIEVATVDTQQTERAESENTFARGQIQWVGSYGTCSKRFKHYKSFCVNGVNISVCSFCHIKIEDSETGVAYILDLYEDKKSQKKMKVRWLHKVEEIRIVIPPPKPLEREVFMTQACQVLRVECCNGVAYVLSLHHYEASGIPPSVPYVYVCLRNFEFKGFDVTTLGGYWNQDIFKTSLISQNLRDIANAASASHKNEQSGLAAVDEDDHMVLGHTIKKAPRSARKRLAGRYDLLNEEGDWTCQRENWLNYDSIIGVTSSPSNLLKIFQDSVSGVASLASAGENCWGRVGDKIEVLSQDSGIRGCWFKCTVLQTAYTWVKLRYDDIQEVDSDKSLEEWEVMRVSDDDELGFRIPGRKNMRPLPPETEMSSVYEQGAAVDAWGGEGWWEGIVLDRNSSSQIKVGVPAANFVAWFEESNVRISKEWVGGQWSTIRPDTNIFNKVSGLRSKRLVSSQVQECCPKSDANFSCELPPGLEVSSECPRFRSAVRENMQANETLNLRLERSANQTLPCNSEKVKESCSNPNSAESAFQTSIFTELKESLTLLTHDSYCLEKVSEPCSFCDHKDIDSKYVPDYSGRTVFEESHCSLAKPQQLDVSRDEESTADMTSSHFSLSRRMSRKRHQDMDSLFSSLTKTSLFPRKDYCADIQTHEQENLTVGIFKINTVTETGNVEFSHSQYGLNGLNSSSGDPIRGPLFNCVPVQSLVLSR